MHLLLIKTSSMGDVIHALPALTDAMQRIPNLKCDWVVEESFQQIPRMHPSVNQVIPVAIRRWRKTLLKSLFSLECRQMLSHLRQQHYDVVLDAQGLLKSAFLTCFAKGARYGFDKQSAREPLAAHFYQHLLHIDSNQHAITRQRELFAKTLGYAVPRTAIDYGIAEQQFSEAFPFAQPYLVFLHGTSWKSKHWPESYWEDLIKIVSDTPLQILLPWGNAEEQARAYRLAAMHVHVTVLPKMDLQQLASVLQKSQGVVAVDTGLGHLAAALAVPIVALYGPTDIGRTSNQGLYAHLMTSQLHCSPCLKKICVHPYKKEDLQPCFEAISPLKVFNALQTQMLLREGSSDAY